MALTVIATPVAADESRIVPYAQAGLGIGSFAVAHDSSVLAPSLGSPTSILAYDGFVAPSLTLGVRGPVGPGRIDLSLETMLLGGRLEDMDFLSGQIVSGDTFSAMQGVSARLTATYAPDAFSATVFGGTLTPYGMATVRATQFRNFGVTCGSVCPGGPVAAGTEVIAQSFASWRVGAGLAWSAALSPADRITVSADAGAGGASLADSHLLRSDLGPSPNIVYGFGSIGATATVAVEHRIGDALTLTANARLAAEGGRGAAVFAARTPAPLGPVPASYLSFTATLTAGIGGTF
jgi:hypothetical protein